MAHLLVCCVQFTSCPAAGADPWVTPSGQYRHEQVEKWHESPKYMWIDTFITEYKYSTK